MKVFYIVLLSMLLLLSLYVNIELDKEFLNQLGLPSNIVLVSILLFVAGKTVSELIFFHLKKWNLTKIIVGMLSLVFIFVSIYSIFLTRLYKSEQMFQKKKQVNNIIEKKKDEIKLKNYEIAKKNEEIKKFGGISCMIVENGMRGFFKEKPIEKMGLRTLQNGDLVFEDCKVPFDNIVGKEGQGMIIFNETIESERAIMAATHLGVLGRPSSLPST